LVTKGTQLAVFWLLVRLGEEAVVPLKDISTYSTDLTNEARVAEAS
jgi:hypothetical protein